MWFQDINKKQFTNYVLLEAKLDLAYWSSIQIEHIDNYSVISEELNQAKAVLREKIDHLIDYVRENITILEGIQRELVQHHLEYVVVVCNSHIELSKSEVRDQEQTSDRIISDENLNIDINFIKHRAELIPMEDTMTQWDRAIYILYDYLECAQSHHGYLHENDLSKRILAAKDLMSPTLIQIHNYCSRYANHLDLDWLAKIKVQDQYTRDCAALFSAGYALATFCGQCKTISESLSCASNKEKQRQWQVIQKRQTIVQEALIKTNIRKSKNLIKQINTLV